MAYTVDFEELVNRYSDAMFRCAFTYCKNQQDAEDVLQTVFLKYLKKRPEFEDENHEKAWFLRCTINVSKNYVHTFWHRNVEKLTDVIPAVTKEQQEIWDIISELPEKYRITLELYYWEGYTIKEIANILNKNESTIGTWFQRGKEQLRQKIMGKR